MPMLVRSPEDIFRAEGTDLYVIHALESSSKNPHGLEEVRAWIKQNLPGTPTELLAPSEYSGVICGGIGQQIRVAFTPEGLQKFRSRWEDETGKSVDERFQCYIYPFERWYQEHGCFVPTTDRPRGVGITSWWYTPEGFIHHELDAEDDQGDGNHPANQRDLWFQAIKKWPKFDRYDPNTLTYGRISRTRHGWFAVYVPPSPFEEAPCFPTVDQIREWFQLPIDVDVVEDDF